MNSKLTDLKILHGRLYQTEQFMLGPAVYVAIQELQQAADLHEKEAKRLRSKARRLATAAQSRENGFSY